MNVSHYPKEQFFLIINKFGRFTFIKISYLMELHTKN